MSSPPNYKTYHFSPSSLYTISQVVKVKTRNSSEQDSVDDIVRRDRDKYLRHFTVLVVREWNPCKTSGGTEDSTDIPHMMIASPNGDAEKDAPDNLSLAGNSFYIAGGPSFKVELGRSDDLISMASRVAGNLPEPNFNLTQLNTIFAKNDLNQTDMIALSGAHTLGFAHCTRFVNRLYSFTPSSPVHLDLNATYAQQLMQA
ncbi:putative zinc finger protein [Hibiscus syriacus]|uniref:peroxidase n=1 Tax=Hibiscus syriacus TaxID=106335 RepID=A0A6A3B2F0_HIBSY|nr:putative zinc finger protein [Hibiscus syriacus]